MRQWPTIVTDGPSMPPNAGAPAFSPTSWPVPWTAASSATGRAPIRGGAVDSRRVRPGDAFFALPGERTDGQRFLRDAASRRCRGARRPRCAGTPTSSTGSRAAGDVSVIPVADGGGAAPVRPGAWRARFDPLVVGVTGSLAKTSTKEQVAEVLAERWPVLRNEGNENNEVGLPLTLLRLRPEHEAAVLEMGLYVAGDIALARGARAARRSAW